jgi:seryl-tRNA synthetase
MSGSRFSVLIDGIARLERALSQYFMDFHISRGYKEVSVPFIVSRSSLEGTGQLPKFENDLFKIENHLAAGEDAFLIPTAEVPVTNLFRDCLFPKDQLPISLVCLSPSFRAEAGAHGTDTRGLLRQHQFWKVELVKICQPKDSFAQHEKLIEDVEVLLQSLELPYRKVLLCSGDTGFSARICYDLEVWLPGQNCYREISSVSNCYEFQARRMKLRFKKSTKANEYCHTLNGSGVAVGRYSFMFNFSGKLNFFSTSSFFTSRALVAILENYQQPDGSVLIPDKLVPYMGGITRLTPKKEGSFLYK